MTVVESLPRHLTPMREAAVLSALEDQGGERSQADWRQHCRRTFQR
jgi:hypothetical protein